MNPTEVKVFYLESSEPSVKHLRVELGIVMTIAEAVERHSLVGIITPKVRLKLNDAQVKHIQKKFRCPFQKSRNFMLAFQLSINYPSIL